MIHTEKKQEPAENNRFGLYIKYEKCYNAQGGKLLMKKALKNFFIRAGFDGCWKTRDFKTIVSVG